MFNLIKNIFKIKVNFVFLLSFFRYSQSFGFSSKPDIYFDHLREHLIRTRGVRIRSYVCVCALDGELVEPGVVVDHAFAALAGDQLAAEHPPGQVEVHDALHGGRPVAEGHQPCRTGPRPR